MKLEDLKLRVLELIDLGEQVLETGKNHRMGFVDTGMFAEFRASSLSFLQRALGEDSQHFKEFDEKVTDISGYYTERGIGILKACQSDINGGWLFTTKGLVSAELFSDFLEMAEHLLSEDYKDAAAVIIGSTLEEHIRQLCIKNNISISKSKSGKEIPLKADFLNAQLKAEEVYSKLDQKQITAWLDLRNNAAHGNYDEYSKEQVESFLSGVLNFINRVPV